MFERCTNCGESVPVIGAQRDAAGVFCSWQCQSYYHQPNFCPHCVAETSDDSAGSTSTINAIGTALFGIGNQCPQCGSVVRVRVFPLIPLGTYRVKFMSRTRFLSRRLVRRLPRAPMMQPGVQPVVSPFATGPVPTLPSAFRCPYCGSPAAAVPRKAKYPRRAGRYSRCSCCSASRCASWGCCCKTSGGSVLRAGDGCVERSAKPTSFFAHAAWVATRRRSPSRP